MRDKKYSGIKWMGNIPSNWSIIPLKQVGFLYGGLSGKAGDDFKVEENDRFYPFIPFTNIFNFNEISLEKLAKVKVAEGEVQNFVQKGDILFLMSSEDYESLGKPALMNHSIDNLCLNSFCKGFHITIDNVESRYLNYYLQSASVREYVRSQGNGFIRINLKASKLACTPILQPTYSEQQSIADFLDRKCADIDNILEKTKTSIEEYKKLKQSVITEAVTKGIRGERPMRDSGIEWIGEIPKEWRSARLKQVTKKIADGTHYSPETTTEGFPYITAKDVHGLGIDYNNAAKISEDSFLSLVKSGCQPKRDDVLLVKDGATTGRVGMITDDTPCVLLSSVAMLQGSDILVPLFLYYQMQSRPMQEQIITSMAGSAMPRTTLTKIAEYVISLPGVEEQQEIASYLDKKCSEIDSIIASKEKFNTELESYKKSLIYEYVTGMKEVPSNA